MNEQKISTMKKGGTQLLIIVIALLLSVILLSVSGYPPLGMIQGLFQSLTGDIAGTIRWTTPLIMAGLAVAITYRAGIFNLGVDGQLLMGAAAGTIASLYVETGSSLLDNILVYLVAMLAGAMFAMIPALLKVYADSNEIVTTLLLNFVAVLFVEYLITGPFRDQASGANLNATPLIPERFFLPRLTFLGNTVANISFFLSIFLVIIVAIVVFKTKFGNEIELVGSNPNFARYVGIDEKKTTIMVFLLSGAIGGLIGITEITGVHHRLLAGFNPDFGMTGIVVTLVALNNPIGVLFSAMFFGLLQNAGGNMERMTQIPSAITQIIEAIIILMLSAKFIFPRWRKYALAFRERFSKTKGHIIERSEVE